MDLYAMSGELFQALGETKSTDLSASPNERTHFSAKGAQATAGLVVRGLREPSTGFDTFLKP